MVSSWLLSASKAERKLLVSPLTTITTYVRLIGYSNIDMLTFTAQGPPEDSEVSSEITGASGGSTQEFPSSAGEQLSETDLALPAESIAKSSGLYELTEDEKLYGSFLYAMKKKIKAIQLPMLTSAFFRDCIQICW